MPSLWFRFLDWLDAPRYCPNCGTPIQVERANIFDPRTGARKPDAWVWFCPRFGHVYESGRPRWHRALGETVKP